MQPRQAFPPPTANTKTIVGQPFSNHTFHYDLSADSAPGLYQTITGWSQLNEKMAAIHDASTTSPPGHTSNL